MDQADWIIEEIVGKSVFALVDSVEENDSQSCNASQRVDTAQTSRFGGIYYLHESVLQDYRI